MPKSREQIDAMIDAAIEGRATHSDPIGRGRRLFLSCYRVPAGN
jgi:hypothetical protein